MKPLTSLIGFPLRKKEICVQYSEAVLDKFDLFCVAEANEIILCETFLFNKRNQEEGETIDTYVSTLRKLAKTCSFKANEKSHACSGIGESLE